MADEVTDTGHLLDMEKVRSMFDLQGDYMVEFGGTYEEDPYPAWRELREKADVHEGTLHELTGFDGPAYFMGLPFPERPHFSLFSFAACDAAFRNDKVFTSAIEPVDIENGPIGPLNSMLSMTGQRHRSYRQLVQPSFVPAKARWWIQNWIETTVNLIIDSIESAGRADLSVDFCAIIPVLTIAGSYGIPVDQALGIREAMHGQWEKLIDLTAPIVAARRENPKDDLISVLVQAEITNEEGKRQRLTDQEIHSFTALLLSAGSGTTWKQMGLTLSALLQRPDLLRAVREDRNLLTAAIEETLRWTPTDPMFARGVAEDIDFFGTHIPEGAIAHICLGPANRDPNRWERPDDFDIFRKLKPALSFGGGSHICLGMHVARAEISVGIGALLDRLPTLRLNPDVEPPRIVGFYERGVTSVPVLFD